MTSSPKDQDKYTFKREDIGLMMCPFCYVPIEKCFCSQNKKCPIKGYYTIVSVTKNDGNTPLQ